MRVSVMVMARALPGLVAAALVLVSSAGCSVDRRSESYRCDGPDDCSGGRVCQQGWCVVASTPDGGSTPGCPGVCGSCVADTCVIECVDAQDCASRIVCPAGMNCDVTCTGNQRCNDGVDCSRANGCTVVCDGVGACAGGVDCGSGACDVSCTSLGACADGIDCSRSCACDTQCLTCGELECPEDDAQCVVNGQCSSAACNLC